jgi:hypothetical protein
MHPINIVAGTTSARTPEKSAVTVNAPVRLTMSAATKVQLIHEALSRARTRLPQAGHTTSTEAPRSARRVAMRARQQAARELGTF